MTQPIRRTHATALTDDELYLLDVMFNGGVRFRHVRREVFGDHWNCQSHGMDDDQLRETLNRWVESRFLTARSSDGDTYFYLTSDGGRQWEMERLPAWNRYVQAWVTETHSGRPCVSIAASTPETRDDCWTVGREVGMWAYSNGRMKTATVENHALISWKPFLPVYILVAALDDWDSEVDWVGWERQRTFWRNVKENAKFWPDTA